MGAIGVIAVNAFRESLRDKILYNLVLFAGLLIGLSVLLADLSITPHKASLEDLFFQEAAQATTRVLPHMTSGRAS